MLKDGVGETVQFTLSTWAHNLRFCLTNNCEFILLANRQWL